MKVLAICGPTATGKSKLAVELALRFAGEIVNFDPQQFYQGLDIGTAKPTLEERKGVPHHLYSILLPSEEMNAGKFVQLADKVVAEISARGKLPILVGGTGLYLRAFEFGLFRVEIPQGLRQEVRNRVRENPQEAYQELVRLDPEYAKKIKEQDYVRLARALEVIYATGKPFSEFHRAHSFQRLKPRYKILKVALRLARGELYNKINERVLAMIKRGWVEEVQRLLDLGYKASDPAFKAIGYRYLYAYIKGELSLEEAISLIQRDTRRYAKRQLTWFKKEKGIHWFHPSEREKIFTLVETFLQEG